MVASTAVAIAGRPVTFVNCISSDVVSSAPEAAARIVCICVILFSGGVGAAQISCLGVKSLSCSGVKGIVPDSRDKAWPPIVPTKKKSTSWGYHSTKCCCV